MSHTDGDTIDENRDAVQRILKRRRVAATEAHYDMLRVLDNAEGGWVWTDTIDWSDVATPLIDADFVAKDVIPQPDGSYRDRLRITDLGRKQYRQIETEIVASPWIHTDEQETD